MPPERLREGGRGGALLPPLPPLLASPPTTAHCKRFAGDEKVSLSARMEQEA
jgi:hypothetical protein